MKSIEQREIDNATFQINAPKRHSHANEQRLTRCVKLIRSGKTLEEVCTEVFGRDNETLRQDIVEAIDKESKGVQIERGNKRFVARPESSTVDFRRVRNA